MKLFSHPLVALIIFLLFAFYSFPLENKDNTVRWIEGSTFPDKQVIELGDLNEKHVPISVWTPGVRKTTITMEGVCTDNNAFEIFFGIDYDKNKKLEIDGEELHFRMGWNNIEKMECKTGVKNVAVTFLIDECGNLEKCFWSDYAHLGNYQNGEPTDIMFNCNWDMICLKAIGGATNGKVTIQMFRSENSDE